MLIIKACKACPAVGDLVIENGESKCVICGDVRPVNWSK